MNYALSFPAPLSYLKPPSRILILNLFSAYMDGLTFSELFTRLAAVVMTRIDFAGLGLELLTKLDFSSPGS